MHNRDKSAKPEAVPIGHALAVGVLNQSPSCTASEPAAASSSIGDYCMVTPSPCIVYLTFVAFWFGIRCMSAKLSCLFYMCGVCFHPCVSSIGDWSLPLHCVLDLCCLLVLAQMSAKLSCLFYVSHLRSTSTQADEQMRPRDSSRRPGPKTE